VAEHVWSVLCTSASIDRETSIVSLLLIVEKLTFTEQMEEQALNISNPILPIDMEIMSWWVRSDYATSESGIARIGLVAPDGEQLHKVPVRISLEGTTGSRTKVRIVSMPFKGFGLYWWVVEMLRPDSEEWDRVARIPIEVAQGPPTSSPTAPAPLSEQTPAARPGSSSRPEPSRPLRRRASRAPRPRGSS
jgi:hypothetical protein